MEEVPSPRELLERARAPDAARPEVDALLRGLALPLKPGEDARARADLLHEILEDKRVRAFTGSKGRRVAHAVGEALLALGYPYALEIPPELLAESRGLASSGAEVPAWVRGLVAFVAVLIGASGLLLVGHVLHVLAIRRWDGFLLLVYGMALLSGSIFIGVGKVLLGASWRPGAPEEEQED